jgi:hypothetical protein
MNVPHECVLLMSERFPPFFDMISIQKLLRRRKNDHLENDLWWQAAIRDITVTDSSPSKATLFWFRHPLYRCTRIKKPSGLKPLFFWSPTDRVWRNQLAFSAKTNIQKNLKWKWERGMERAGKKKKQRGRKAPWPHVHDAGEPADAVAA